MAIQIHIAKVKNIDGVLCVLDDGVNTNTADNPSVEDYIIAEAADDFCCNHADGKMVITYNVADMNGAS